MEMSTFNVDDGFLEAMARGYRGRILGKDQYQALIQSDTLEDLKQHLCSHELDYWPFLEDISTEALDTKALDKALKKSLVSEFHYLRGQANYPLSKFLDFVTYGYMIENLCLLIKGSLKNEAADKLIESCNPLGTFPEMVTVHGHASTPKDLYEAILIDSPLGPYFIHCITLEDLTENGVEQMKDKLYKEYLTDFYNFCGEIGGTTKEVMQGLLEYMADMRAINIAVNAHDHAEVSEDDKLGWNPAFGSLYPEGFELLAKAKEEDGIYNELQKHYGDTFGRIVDEFNKNKNTDAEKFVEELMMEEEVRRNELAFYEQFHYGIFWSYVRLKEQEIRNIVWIAECIKQKKKNRVHQNVVYMFEVQQ